MSALLTAGLLRFWQLGDLPDGLYRDEAVNGLDALEVINGQRSGQSPFYFPANNGREPLYVYLTTVSVAVFGNSAFAVRLAAAVVGTLTTLTMYLLGREWFGQRVGWLSAWLWAITVWPLHLSRIGLRPILLSLTFTLTLWVATLAYRQQADRRRAGWLWFLAGLLYGLSFYTYLPVRFTPILLLLFLLYLRLTSKHKPLWPGLVWAAAGTMLIITPLAVTAVQDSDLVLGRANQVSILNPDINEGSVVTALGRNLIAALGLFFIRGDAIVRHNPAGRPLFDLFMVIPFLTGLVWCFRSWRRPPAMALLLWIAVLLGPTILAEDAPHFLRASGVLPAALMVPAIGLSQLWSWSKLPSGLGLGVVIVLTIGSLGLTVNDYFIDYGQDATTGFWFESSARELAEQANRESKGTTMIDHRYREGWPSVPFLLDEDKEITFFRPDELPEGGIEVPVSIYTWPHAMRDSVTAAIGSPALVAGETGALAQGDLDAEPYPLFIRYRADSAVNMPVLANFGDNIQLRKAEVTLKENEQLQVDLYWSASKKVDQDLAAFVHVVSPESIVDQSDTAPSQGNWPTKEWRPGLVVRDSHIIELSEEFDENIHTIQIGLYDTNTRDRLQALGTGGEPASDSWRLTP